MEERTQRGIFFSKGSKALVLTLFFISIATFTVGSVLLVGMFRSGLDPEQITKANDMSYEETYRCASDMTQYLHRLPEMIRNGEPFTTDGELDLKKKVDITDLSASGKKMNKNTTYTVEDIRELEEENQLNELRTCVSMAYEKYNNLNMAAGGTDGEADSQLEESEDTQAAQAGDAAETAGEEAANTTEDVSQEWMYSQAFLYLYENGKEMETRLPQSEVSLAEYARNNPEDVSLADLYENLIAAGDMLDSYLSARDELRQDSNVKYVITNADTGVVYTNVDEEEWEDVEAKINAGSSPLIFRGRRVDGRLKDVKASTDAEKYLKNYYSEKVLSGDNEEIILMLDTEYQVVDIFSHCHDYYEKYASWGNVFLAMALCGLILGIVTCVLSTIQAGRRREDRELHLCSVDRVPTEVMLAVIAVPLGLMISLGFIYIDTTGIWDLFAVVLVVLGELLLGMLFMGAYLSIVRRLKGHKFWNTSLCYAIIQSCKSVYMARKTSGRIIIAFVLLILCNLIFGGVGILVALIVDGLVLLYLIRENAGRQVIKDGLARIASGELDFKINGKELIGDNKEMAEAVNHVGDGLMNAVKETLKSERLKADLITNVSHDIKTPLTSIINYVDLLKRENIQDPKIRGYIQVLDSKSQRLKQLTEDLVEASKISSGNVVLEMQPIRLGELIRQTNGEFEEKFAAKDLEMVCRIPDEPVVIMADGRRMWRVIENLYSNVAKYAMPGTRVYVEVKKIGCRVIFEIKNISEHPLNIRAEELTERFIRGDVSRSTEGSGLGLSIAQNLVRLQHGTFDIYLDGDLFKVTITFEVSGFEV